MKVQESYIDTSTAQSTAPGFFGSFSFRCYDIVNKTDVIYMVCGRNDVGACS